ncbi:hypothetical protein GJA_4939 [Janthinobacterium agaricidamnosum NBRC 102515 = DSM 9628]|uniref:Uncharacterized protein n=1 Tax=Janthinobacterium agaricidamnosum NBRC 102515 = DSM 9628 TaxID=1349767 RepID=W0VCC0_9BURK|nr:hypothetical protein GJA_4939 [Janthinobacterium agaricidamnosum NBRC 102515 = DSM 9628]
MNEARKYYIQFAGLQVLIKYSAETLYRIKRFVRLAPHG